MAKNLLNKYVWLVETINKAKKITFEEINEKWLDIIFPLRVVNADAKIQKTYAKTMHRFDFY